MIVGLVLYVKVFTALAWAEYIHLCVSVYPLYPLPLQYYIVDLYPAALNPGRLKIHSVRKNLLHVKFLKTALQHDVPTSFRHLWILPYSIRLYSPEASYKSMYASLANALTLLTDRHLPLWVEFM